MTEQEITPDTEGEIVAQVPIAPTTDNEKDVGTTDTLDTEREQEDPETFPREYVQQLRKEAADARVRAKATDDLAGRLHTSLVAATGKLADPTDLPYDESHLDDPEALTAAIDALLEAKPHLASRKPTGDAGQGVRGNAPASVDLAAILRSRAG